MCRRIPRADGPIQIARSVATSTSGRGFLNREVNELLSELEG